MFNKSNRIKELEAQCAELNRTIANLPVLVSIARNGRENVFTFRRNASITTIETMGMLSDTPDQWKQELFGHG